MKRAQGKQNKDQTLGMESSVRCRVPHPWATSLTQLQRSEQRHKNKPGEQAPKPEDANPSEETQLLALQPSGSQGRVTFGAELLTQHSSIPG